MLYWNKDKTTLSRTTLSGVGLGDITVLKLYRYIFESDIWLRQYRHTGICYFDVALRALFYCTSTPEAN